MLKKRGFSLTSFQIITFIMALIGFLIILNFIISIDLKGQSEDEICRLSVRSRATAPEAVSSYIPLQCTTKKICLTDDKENCSEFLGESTVKKINLPNSESDAARLVENTTAEAMLECWKIMGEGKLSLFSGGAKSFGLSPQKVTCVICSRIAFNIPEETRKRDILGTVNINDYMANAQVPGGSGSTYLQTFTDRSTQSYARAPDSVDEKLQERIKKQGQIEEFKTETTELAVIFSQIKPNDYGETLGDIGKFGATAAVGVFFTPGLNKVAAATVLSGPGIIITGLAATGVTLYSLATVYEGKVAAAGYCGQFTSQEGGTEEGCSIVQVLPYEKNAINSICEQLEGGA